jgi:hypothetical protein
MQKFQGTLIMFNMNPSLFRQRIRSWQEQVDDSAAEEPRKWALLALHVSSPSGSCCSSSIT